MNYNNLTLKDIQQLVDQHKAGWFVESYKGDGKELTIVISKHFIEAGLRYDTLVFTNIDGKWYVVNKL